MPLNKQTENSEVESEVADAVDKVTSAEWKSALNSAVRSQLKRELPKLISEALQNQSLETGNKLKTEEDMHQSSAPAQQDSSLLKELNAAKAAIKKLEQINKQKDEEARISRAQSLIQANLRGKVLDNWEDKAIEDVAKSLKVDGDFVSLTVNGSEFSLEDGIEEWLKSPTNKRYLPAPKTPVRQPVTQKVTLPPVRTVDAGATGRRKAPPHLTEADRQRALEEYKARK